MKEVLYTKVEGGNRGPIWIPKHELEQYEKLRSQMSQEERLRMAYYMWNNFSYEGYDEWRAKQVNI